MSYRSPIPPALLTIGMTLLACGGEPPQEAPEQAAVAAAPAPPAISVSGPIDSALADQGATLFAAKGCNACHRVGGGRLTGPDLQGVIARRTPEWIVAMITRPDSMLKTDPTARQLLMEYGTPMTNMGVTADEARALIEYLRRESP